FLFSRDCCGIEGQAGFGGEERDNFVAGNTAEGIEPLFVKLNSMPGHRLPPTDKVHRHRVRQRPVTIKNQGGNHEGSGVFGVNEKLLSKISDAKDSRPPRAATKLSLNLFLALLHELRRLTAGGELSRLGLCRLL